MNKGPKIIIAVVVIIALAAVASTALAPYFDDKITFNEITMTVPDGVIHTTTSDNITFQKGFNGDRIFTIIKNNMDPQSFDANYNALSSGQLTPRRVLSIIPQVEHVNYTNISLSTFHGKPTIILKATVDMGNETENLVINIVRTDNNVYAIYYFPNNEKSSAIYDSITFEK